MQNQGAVWEPLGRWNRSHSVVPAITMFHEVICGTFVVPRPKIVIIRHK